MHRIFNSVKVAIKNCTLTLYQNLKPTGFKLWKIDEIDFTSFKNATISDTARLQDALLECHNYIEQTVFASKSKGRLTKFMRWL